MNNQINEENKIERKDNSFRNNFVKYINSNLQRANNIAIVDSVSKFFSAQRFIEKCINKNLQLGTCNTTLQLYP